MSFGVETDEDAVDVTNLGAPVYLYDKINGAYRGRVFEKDIPDVTMSYHFTHQKPLHAIVSQTAFYVGGDWVYKKTVGTAQYYNHFRYVFMSGDWEFYAPGIDGMQYYISVDGSVHLSGKYPTVQVQEMLDSSKHIIRNDLNIYIMEHDRVLVVAPDVFDGRMSIKF